MLSNYKVKQRLDSEVRVREGRDARLILDTQELAASRDRERQLRQDIVKVQTDLDKERIKNKTIIDKVLESIINQCLSY